MTGTINVGFELDELSKLQNLVGNVQHVYRVMAAMTVDGPTQDEYTVRRPRMTKRELIERLAGFPDDLRVVVQCEGQGEYWYEPAVGVEVVTLKTTSPAHSTLLRDGRTLNSSEELNFVDDGSVAEQCIELRRLPPYGGQ